MLIGLVGWTTADARDTSRDANVGYQVSLVINPPVATEYDWINTQATKNTQLISNTNQQLTITNHNEPYTAYTVDYPQAPTTITNH